ncbi:hypothetical protein [Nitrosomonas sp.]|uniref:hypothetical protein n=1 Tax=Nitrosomonas sp. TaxID=42353 RepID=UPI001D917938|nr:hypothetical protein [Nitrosomonas sp.]MBX3618086.1 hypothetical protein [Nitrosomonas sp.]
MHYRSQLTLLQSFVSALAITMTIGCSTDSNPKMNTPEAPGNSQSTDTKSTQNGESMKFSPNPPEGWLWSHDINPMHINDAEIPGMHMTRLAAYGSNNDRRFAAIIYRIANVESLYLPELAAAELDAKIAASGARPVSVTAGVVNGEIRFTLVLHKGPGTESKVYVNLDETAFKQLAVDGHRITDFTTYIADGIRKYAAIVEARPGPSVVFTHFTVKELDAQLRKHKVTPIRIRGYYEGDTRYFSAVAEQLNVGDWNWYDEINADKVANKLDSNHGYPFDLDAYRQPGTEYGVYYTVIMYHDPNDY